MTSAINGRIVFKQGPRNYLEANIRRNSLVFDTDNNILLYSPSGTNYYEFYPGQGGGVSGTVYWNDIIGEPTASVSTSGLLSVSDWNKFNNKADTSAIPSTSSFVTSSYVNSQIQSIPFASVSTSGHLTSSDWNKFNAKADLSAVSGGGTVNSVTISSSNLVLTNPTVNTNGTIGVNLSAVTSQGTSTKVVYDDFGRIISGGNLSVNDIPNLSAQYIPVGSIQTASQTTNGLLTSSDWNEFNSKAETSAIPTSSSIQDLIYLYAHPSITLRNNVSTTTPSATSANLVTFPINYVPNILAFQLVGQSSGTYSVSANIYGSLGNNILVHLTTGIIDNINSVDGAILLNTNGYTKFAADVSVSGTTSGISVKVVS